MLKGSWCVLLRKWYFEKYSENMQRIDNPPRSEWPKILQRATQTVTDIQPVVQEVFDAVRKEGDPAVLRYTEQFDRAVLSDLTVSAEEIKTAGEAVSSELKAAIRLAHANIETFHKAQQTHRIEVETQPGLAPPTSDNG